MVRDLGNWVTSARSPADLQIQTENYHSENFIGAGSIDGNLQPFCASCRSVTEISAQLELCLQTIVSEYEKEISRLRNELESCTKGRRTCQNNKDSDCADCECKCNVYGLIPGFKDEMKKLGDTMLPHSKDTAMLYYEAAAINGCSDSSLRVAMNCLGADSAGAVVDYNKAKVRAPLSPVFSCNSG
jgi:hypothetical protein